MCLVFRSPLPTYRPRTSSRSPLVALVGADPAPYPGLASISVLGSCVCETFYLVHYANVTDVFRSSDRTILSDIAHKTLLYLLLEYTPAAVATVSYRKAAQPGTR